jgi:hypothetical protein
LVGSEKFEAKRSEKNACKTDLALLRFALKRNFFWAKSAHPSLGPLCWRVQEACLGFMDIVNILGEAVNDIVVAKEVQRAVEEATGTILNRNHKTAVLALAL